MDLPQHKNTVSGDEIKAVADQIASKFNPQKIILFGSYQRGVQTRYSDVDLLVVLDHGRQSDDVEVEVALSVRHAFPMDILVRTPGQIEKRLELGDDFFRDIIERGKVLYERTNQ